MDPPAANEEELFIAKIKKTIKSGFVSLGLAYGYKLGLFDILCGLQENVTSAELAELSGCKERYIREWLHLMVSADIIEMNEAADAFLLPYCRRSCFSDKMNQSWLNVSPAVVTIAMGLQPTISCSKLNGPTGFSPKQANDILVPWEEERPKFFHSYLRQILTLIPGLQKDLESGIACCDIGGGRGYYSLILAEKFPASSFISADINNNANTIGEQLSRERLLANITFSTADACKMPASWTNKFNFIQMCYSLHDVADPAACVSEAYRMLQTGGYLAVLYFGIDSDVKAAVRHDKGIHLFCGSLIYCMGLGSDGACIGNQKITTMLEDNGFVVNFFSVENFNDCVFICHKI